MSVTKSKIHGQSLLESKFVFYFLRIKFETHIFQKLVKIFSGQQLHQKLRPESLSLIFPGNKELIDNEDLAKHLYSDDDSLYAIKAQHICGLKISFAESLSDFKAKKSVSLEEHLKINDGFNLEYDDSMFLDFNEFPVLAEA